jgi:hypothetical protein
MQDCKEQWQPGGRNVTRILFTGRIRLCGPTGDRTANSSPTARALLPTGRPFQRIHRRPRPLTGPRCRGALTASSPRVRWPCRFCAVAAASRRAPLPGPWRPCGVRSFLTPPCGGAWAAQSSPCKNSCLGAVLSL